jgi:hypothetical protein
VCSRLARFAAAVAAAALLAVPAASASPGLLVGILDDANTLNFPSATFTTLGQLHARVVRMNLSWRAVAPTRPARPGDPTDPAYRWDTYDAAVTAAKANGIKVLLSIVGTPVWANGGGPAAKAPTSASDLHSFAYAAARHYSGSFGGPDGTPLPAVRLWLAWNEPNNPIYLAPQYVRSGGRWVIQSARSYARICAAIYGGVHATGLAGEKVGCGATAPRGNNDPTSSRPSVSPLAFLRAVKAGGLRRFDAWAHHPYAGSRFETPASRPSASTAITLGNIDVLQAELKRLYGPKRLWLTEYGWQTNPPDALLGVPWATQAAYLTQAVAIARRNPGIDMLVWFLLKDDPVLSGWQSGLETATGKHKPSFAAFARAAG